MKNLKNILAAIIALGVAGCNQNTINPPLATQTISGKISAMSADRSSITVAGQNIKLVSVAPASQSPAEQRNVQTRFYWKGHVKVNDSSASVSALSVGQSVTVTTSGDEASEVQVKLEVKGAISSIDLTAKTLVVAGKTVLVDSSTRFDLSGDDDHAPSSVRTLADLKAGDFVEVTGSTDAATGNVLASKIEVKSATELSEDGEDDDSEIKGTVAGLTTDTFTLGTVTVHCVSPCALPTGLKNGDFVEAEGRLTASKLEAKKVKFEDDLEDHPAAGSSIVLSDDVNHLGASSFDLGRYSIDYSTATTITGTLANKAVVKVEGKVDASNTKLVHATTVTVLSSGGNNGGGSGGGNSGGGSDDGSGHK